MGATVDPKTLALTNTYNINGKDTNVVVGQLGAAPNEDQQVTKWALKALAQKEGPDGLALKAGTNNVRPVAYKEGAALRPKQDETDNTKFTLADKGGLEPKPVEVKPADAPTSPPPQTAEFKPVSDTEVGAFLNKIAKAPEKTQQTACTQCHDMDFKNGVLSKADSGTEIKSRSELSKLGDAKMKSFVAALEKGENPQGMPQADFDALRTWYKTKLTD